MNLLTIVIPRPRGRGTWTRDANPHFDLGRYAADEGVRILFTCPDFGPQSSSGRRVGRAGTKTQRGHVPRGVRHLLPCIWFAHRLVTTSPPAAKSMADEFFAMQPKTPAPPAMECTLAEGAMKALAAGDTQLHDELIVKAAERLADCDVLMLGQFSMARAQAQVARALSKPVLSSPDSAVRALRRIPAGPAMICCPYYFGSWRVHEVHRPAL